MRPMEVDLQQISPILDSKSINSTSGSEKNTFYDQTVYFCLDNVSKLAAGGSHFPRTSRKFHHKEYWTLKTHFATEHPVPVGQVLCSSNFEGSHARA